MTAVEKVLLGVLDTVATLGCLLGLYMVFTSPLDPGEATAISSSALAVALIPVALAIVAHNSVMRRIASRQVG
jgi:hypothetical protein